MAQRLRIYWTSFAGNGHDDEITGDHLVATVNDTTATVRVTNDGQLASVHTFTRVSRVDWYPDAERGSRGRSAPS